MHPSQSGLSPALVAVLEALSISALTPIQSEAIPAMLNGDDLLALSPTGSGKTLAFALPMLDRLDLSARAISGLVLCPTRELAAQVARELRRVGRDLVGLRVIVLAGGEPIRPQAEALTRGVHIAVGTPGRVLDLLSRDALRLDSVRTVVLDEADRMLDMGFRADVETILRATPKNRQTALFSATFPETIEALSRAHQRSPKRVEVAKDEENTPDIRHILRVVAKDKKLDALFDALCNAELERAIVFCATKVNVAEVEAALSKKGASVAALHGDLEQFDRDQVLARFRGGSIRVLVATDVAARGIDIAELDLVVNYDLPNRSEDYVHRVGRTARAGRSGVALSIVLDGREQAARSLLGEVAIHPERYERVELDRAALAKPATMSTLFISAGRKEKLRPGDVLGALTGDAGLEGSLVGKIEIHDHFTYVAVRRSSAGEALAALSEGKIKGRRFRVRRVG